MPDLTAIPIKLTAGDAGPQGQIPPSPLWIKGGVAPGAILKELIARDIAPALGVSKRAVAKRSIREAWAFVLRDNPRGGGREKLFIVASLPEDARLAVVRHYGRLSTPLLASPREGEEFKNPPGPLCKGEKISASAPFAKTAGQAGASLLSSAATGVAVCAREGRADLPALSRQTPGGNAAMTLRDRRGDLLPPWADRIAKARADLVGAYWKARERANPPGPLCKGERKSSVQVTDEFLIAYNSGLLLPALFQVLGQVARSTLERWRKDLEDARHDYAVLAPKWGRHRAGTISISDHEARYLFSQLLHQNRIKIGTAINVAKFILEQAGLPSPSSPATLRRAVETFRRQHFDIWTFYREGEKALIDKVLPYIERDDSLIDVGDVLVADGHRCNFYVHNPFDGKKCRPIMVGFYDWKSRVLVGYQFALEENVQCIAAAMRSAILRLGKLPKIVLIDNGKAFKAKVFTGDIDLEQAGILGMFARLGIKVVFAWPYNARAKTIERFFQDFGNSFERYLPNYSGASIGDKPASLSRNEKLMKAFYKETILPVPQVMAALAEWHKFHRWTPHPTVPGKQKGEVFEAGRGPGVDEAELRYMMMDAKVERIGRNGVTFMKADYMSEEIYGLRDEVVVRYDFEDLSRIFVYTRSGEFICQANRLKGVHPMAQYLGESKDVEELNHRIGRQKSLKKQTTKLARQSLGMTGGLDPLNALPWDKVVAADHRLPEKIEAIQAECDGPPPIFSTETDIYAHLMKLKRALTDEEEAWLETFGKTEIGRMLRANERRKAI